MNRYTLLLILVALALLLSACDSASTVSDSPVSRAAAVRTDQPTPAPTLFPPRVGASPAAASAPTPAQTHAQPQATASSGVASAPTPAPTQAQPQAAASPGAVATVAPAQTPVQQQSPTSNFANTTAQPSPTPAAATPSPQPLPTSKPSPTLMPSPTSPPGPTSPPVPKFGNELNDLAHPFTLPSVSGSPFSLESERGQKKVVLVFYRAFW